MDKMSHTQRAHDLIAMADQQIMYHDDAWREYGDAPQESDEELNAHRAASDARQMAIAYATLANVHAAFGLSMKP